MSHRAERRGVIRRWLVAFRLLAETRLGADSRYLYRSTISAPSIGVNATAASKSDTAQGFHY
ncbi:hypothetical protein BC938DRAFT_478807 [Jimgerdemannia flammicorona]|uniref:Uncharacterized protein n=1 Tax=Jimgerdemannia flammicorona TaxID=994334 RepID=A0A433QYF2_9FUNG|nr:hypothetical protein BC938DRAFT_478807 [Jimgerdemannia flammicorona]